jgi:hypothetical protein
MTDDDLYRLYREEQRLYREYIHANTEDQRHPKAIAEKRDAWIALHRKLREVLPPDRLRELLRPEVVGTRDQAKKRRQPVLELEVSA